MTRLQLRRKEYVMIDHKLNMSQCHAVANKGKHLARICKRHGSLEDMKQNPFALRPKPQLGGRCKVLVLAL